MQLTIFLERINKLITSGLELTAKSYGYDNISGQYVKNDLFHAFRASSLALINDFYGQNHSYHKEFNEYVASDDLEDAKTGIAILNAVKSDIENGYLQKVEDIASAEIFSDIMDQAIYLLEKDFKDAAAVMIGGVLESTLRRLCFKNGIEILELDGKTPKEANTLNAELYKKKIYEVLDNKSITSWLGLRNNAAHGEYKKYTQQQVEIMKQGVLDFINRKSNV
jgi:hypothetical protein